MQAVLKAWGMGLIELWVSLHTLAELEVKPDNAFDLAKRCKQLPHWVIGTWNDKSAVGINWLVLGMMRSITTPFNSN